MNRLDLHDLVPQSPAHQPDWLRGARRKRTNRRAFTAGAVAAAVLMTAPLTVQLLRGPGSATPAPASPTPTATQTPPSSVPVVSPTEKSTSSEAQCAQSATATQPPSAITSAAVCGVREPEGTEISIALSAQLVGMIQDSLAEPAGTFAPDYTPFILTAPKLLLNSAEGSFALSPAVGEDGRTGYAWQSDTGWRFWSTSLPIEQELALVTTDLRHTSGSPDLDVCATAPSGYQMAELRQGMPLVWCDWSSGTLHATRLADDLAWEVITSVEGQGIDQVAGERTGSYLAAIDSDGVVNAYSIMRDGTLASTQPDGTGMTWRPTGVVGEELRELGLSVG